MRLLKDETVKIKIQKHIQEALAGQEKADTIDDDLEILHRVNNEILEQHLRPQTPKKKVWMTDEILVMMEERRNAKDTKNYNTLDRQIKKAIRDAKEKWLTGNCEEIERLEEKHDTFNLHKKVKAAAGLYRPKKAGCLTDSEGKPIVTVEEKMATWRKYVENTFKDERQNSNDSIDGSTGPPFTIDEVRSAIRRTKDGKATGPDNFHSEFLKLMDDNGIKWITSIFNDIYNTGQIPQSWVKSTFVTLSKTSNAKKCDNYRIISLMSHLLKTFLKIIHSRIYKKCDERVAPTQFGFRDALGTREALFAIQVLFQRCRDVNCDVYLCFIDYQKAFDRIKHDKLMTIMKETGIDDKDLRIIKNIYYKQTANIKIDNQLTDVVSIQRGVRQGCILSPLLFNIYSEQIFKQALEDVDEGILVNGERLNNIRYADDTVVFADTIEGLQTLMTHITDVSQQYGLDINIKKTKYMTINKRPIPNTQLLVNGRHIEKVESYTYLGTNVNSQWDHSVEIKQRIAKARSAFIRMNSIFKCRDLRLTTKCRLLKCYIFPVLLYGMEAWTLTEASMKKLEAFEMWCYRRILRISWVDRVTNTEILRRMRKERELLLTIKKRKLEYFGHIMRNKERYGLLQLIIEGKVFGRRGPGRRRISWLHNLRTWFNMTSTGLFRAAANKVKIAMMIADIRNG